MRPREAVQTEKGFSFVLDGASMHGIPGDEVVGVHVLQIPGERLAAQPLPQGAPLADISVVVKFVVNPRTGCNKMESIN